METPAKYESQNSLPALLGSVSIKKKFEELLGKKSAGFISSILSVVSLSSGLRKADPMSVISAAAIAASLDLPINPSLSFAHIVPYSGKAQFQLGWRGYVQLAQRTGQYQTMNCAPVYEGELGEYNRFTGQVKMNINGKKSDKVIGYLAYFRLINGFEKYLYMTHEEVERHGKRYSKSYGSQDGRWQQDFDAMALKTVVKMLLGKWGILSIEMQTAISADQAVIASDGSYDYVDGVEPIESETKKKTEAMKDRLKPKPSAADVSEIVDDLEYDAVAAEFGAALESAEAKQ